MDFDGSEKKLKKDLQKLGLTNGIWWFRDPDLDPVLTMVWVIFFKTWFFESRWYQDIESSRNQWIQSDVIWRARIVGSELVDSPLEWIGERDRYSSNFEEVTLRAPALQGVSSLVAKGLYQNDVIMGEGEAQRGLTNDAEGRY